MSARAMATQPTSKDYATTGAGLALHGYELWEHRTCNGTAYVIRGGDQSTVVSCWHDVIGVLASLGAKP